MRGWLREHQTRLISLGLVLALFAAPIVGLLWMTAIPGKSWSGPLPPLDASEADLAKGLRGHVEALERSAR